MKVYFTASVNYREKYLQIYKRIVNKLIKLGYQVEATHVLKHTQDGIYKRNEKQRIEDYQEMMDWISEADIIVAEISFPSTVTTGHVVTRALERGKPVLALYSQGSVPPLLLGLELERFRLVEYNPSNLEKVIEMEIKELLKIPDSRFTLLFSQSIINHLDRIAENGISRSEYIRKLIKDDIKKRHQ